MELGLSISPGPCTIEGVAVNFTVTVTNLNDSSTGPMHGGVRNTRPALHIHSRGQHAYSFQVTAVNGAGTGIPSETITRSLP